MNKKKRDIDFRRCCAEVIRKCRAGGHVPHFNEIYVRAMNMSPQCFYLDNIYAYNKVCRILSAGPDILPSKPAGHLWLELTAMVAAEMIRSGCNLTRALDRVLRSRRPSSFHISPDRALRIASERPRKPCSVSPSTVFSHACDN